MNRNTIAYINILKDIFILANEHAFDMDDFITKFMKSSFMEKFDKLPCGFYLQKDNIFYDFLSENNIKKAEAQTNEEILYYVAFIYIVIQRMTNESSKEIIAYLPYKFIHDNFILFHTLDYKEVYIKGKILYNVKMNAMRKMRSNHYLFFKNVDKEIRFYLMNNIIEKMFNFPYFKDMNFDNSFEENLQNNEEKSIVCYQEIDRELSFKNVIENDYFNSLHYFYDYRMLLIYNPLNKEFNEEDLFKFNGKFNYIFVFNNQNEITLYLDDGTSYKFYTTISNFDVKKATKMYDHRF